MIPNNTFEDIISVLQSISSTFLSVGFAVYTLVLAFIQNKKDFLKEMDELINNEGISATLLRKSNGAKKFTSRMKSINKDALILVIASLVGLIVSYVLMLYRPVINQIYLLFLIAIILIAIGVYAIKVLWKLIVRSKQ